MGKNKTKNSTVSKLWEALTWDVVVKVVVLALFANNYNLAVILIKQNDPAMLAGAISVGLATLIAGYYTIIKK